MKFFGTDIQTTEVQIASGRDIQSEYTLEDGSVVRVAFRVDFFNRINGTDPNGEPTYIAIGMPHVRVMKSVINRTDKQLSLLERVVAMPPSSGSAEPAGSGVTGYHVFESCIDGNSGCLKCGAPNDAPVHDSIDRPAYFRP